MHPTYWKEITTIMHQSDQKRGMKAKVAAGMLGRLKAIGLAKASPREERRAAQKKKRELPESLLLIQRWQEAIGASMPPGAFEPVDLQEYAKVMTAKYEELYPYPEDSEDSIDHHAVATA